MIVCVCRGKSERDVLQAIERGASSIPGLQRCGIGTECGSCHRLLRNMLAEAREREIAAIAALSAAAPAA